MHALSRRSLHQTSWPFSQLPPCSWRGGAGDVDVDIHSCDWASALFGTPYRSKGLPSLALRTLSIYTYANTVLSLRNSGRSRRCRSAYGRTNPLTLLAAVENGSAASKDLKSRRVGPGAKAGHKPCKKIIFPMANCAFFLRDCSCTWS